MTRLLLALLLLAPSAWAIDGSAAQRTILPSEDGSRYSTNPAGDKVIYPPERIVRYSAPFDSPLTGGTFDTNYAAVNRGGVTALKDDGTRACSTTASVLATYIAGTTFHVRTEDTETVYPCGTTPNCGGSGNTITPRAGSGFLYQKLDEDLSYGYDGVTSCPNDTSTNDKPRAALYWRQSAGFGELMPWDQTFLYGYSVFVPSGLEAENCGNNNLSYREMALGELGGADALASYQNMSMRFATRTDGDTDPSFFIQFYIEPNALNNNNTTEYHAWLGDVSLDRGQWIDFVYRVRINPYATSTVVSGAYGGTFDGNRGILQIWRTNPDDRDGPLVKVYDLAAPTTAMPKNEWCLNDTACTFADNETTAAVVGGTTATHTPGHPSTDIRDQVGLAFNATTYPGLKGEIRMYKHSWGTGRGCVPFDEGGQSTVTSGLYHFGYDEIYFALESDDAAVDCDDVSGGRQECTGYTRP